MLFLKFSSCFLGFLSFFSCDVFLISRKSTELTVQFWIPVNIYDFCTIFEKLLNLGSCLPVGLSLVRLAVLVRVCIQDFVD